MIFVDISDDRFWQILFDEACVEGQQKERIENELKKIITYDLEAVVRQLEKNHVAIIDDYTEEYEDVVFLEEAIDIVRKAGVK